MVDLYPVRVRILRMNTRSAAPTPEKEMNTVMSRTMNVKLFRFKV